MHQCDDHEPMKAGTTSDISTDDSVLVVGSHFMLKADYLLPNDRLSFEMFVNKLVRIQVQTCVFFWFNCQDCI